MPKVLNIIGGGLAGCEAAWQAAGAGIQVVLYEMRDGKNTTPAHQTDNLAELVCSNSFRNDDINSAIGLLHHEMRLANSLIMQAADATKVPAGSALAMDRELFSKYVQNAIANHPNITIKRQKIDKLPTEGHWIIATGPLTADSLMQDIIKFSGAENLAFFDAIAPIVYKDSIDFSKAWYQSRYDKGNGNDYINCPLTKEQYYQFVEALLAGDKTEFKEWEKDTPYFDGCLPIEVMAERGKDTLAFGPMKPVGLTNPHAKEKPFAVVQLRQDNKLGTLYNIVGFQTKLKYQAQQEIFRMIPGLENVEFARLGGIHRNSFINSPKLLSPTLKFKNISKEKLLDREDGTPPSILNLGDKTTIEKNQAEGIATPPYNLISEGKNGAKEVFLDELPTPPISSTSHELSDVSFQRRLESRELNRSPLDIVLPNSGKNKESDLSIRFAGQVTGVEGYVESAACGLLAGIFAANEILNKDIMIPPQETALGALLNHITGGAEAECFQPMNINFGLFPPIKFTKKLKKPDRKTEYSKRAQKIISEWIMSL